MKEKRVMGKQKLASFFHCRVYRLPAGIQRNHYPGNRCPGVTNLQSGVIPFLGIAEGGYFINDSNNI
jgi:hypothetical protein